MSDGIDITDLARRLNALELTIRDFHQLIFDLSDAAGFCGCSKKTIERAMAAGDLPQAKDGNPPRFHRKELLLWLESRRCKGAKYHIPMTEAA